MTVKHESNRPEGLPTAGAWIAFFAFVSLLLLDVCLYQNMLLKAVQG